jgi:hypothetical protein
MNVSKSKRQKQKQKQNIERSDERCGKEGCADRGERADTAAAEAVGDRDDEERRAENRHVKSRGVGTMTIRRQ